MKQTPDIYDIYSSIKQLITELDVSGNTELSDVLNHRMYQVAWASGSELLEELKDVFTESLQTKDINFSEPIRCQIQQILCTINRYLVT